MKVSVGIKALNEEKHISKALESALAAAQQLGGEVVLADSGSTDRTLEIASRYPTSQYPLRVVQLANPAERCCGAGAQLAFENAQGEYFYLLDGDMVLHPDFLPAGIAYLEANPDVAGVGGQVREMETTAEEFQIRAKATAQNVGWQPGIVDRLDCGGLYRADAIRDVGWFADRNLHAFEEFELGARLQAKGWKLARINHPAVEHYGHALSGYKLLVRRMRSGYSGAPGEVLRGALGRAHLPVVLRGLGHVRNGIAVICWWLALLASIATQHWAVLLGLILLPLAFLSWRRGSFRLGLYSLTAWNVSALGLIQGLLRARTNPQRPIQAKVLAEPEVGMSDDSTVTRRTVTS